MGGLGLGSTMDDIALEVENLVKIYHPRRQAPVRAVDGMSFGVARGTIFGLLGPNGAGKTSILKVLSTLSRPTGGRARLLGFDVVAQPLEVRRRISMVLQETAVEMFLSVRDNLLTFARFHSVDRNLARQRAAVVLERFHLAADADRKVQDLSGGQRRRVQVAKVFMVTTPVLFLDEFSTGMDPILKRSVMGYLREEARQGRTIVLTTQVLSEAEELCDDILIMNKGRQVARGDLHALKLLSEGVYEVVMTFDELPASIEGELAHLAPLRMKINQNTIELALKAGEARVLELVTELARPSRQGSVQRVDCRDSGSDYGGAGQPDSRDPHPFGPAAAARPRGCRRNVGVVFLLRHLRAEDPAQRPVQQRHFGLLLRLSVRQLDFLSARAAPGVVPRRGARQPHHLAGRPAAVRLHRHRRAAAHCRRSGGFRGVLARFVRLRRPVPPAAGIAPAGLKLFQPGQCKKHIRGQNNSCLWKPGLGVGKCDQSVELGAGGAGVNRLSR